LNTSLTKQLEQLPIKERLLYLEEALRDNRSVSRQYTKLIDYYQQQAVDQGLATWVYKPSRELAPTKDQFVGLFGQEAFDQVKRPSKPERELIWLLR